jgi:hypothetical protein
VIAPFAKVYTSAALTQRRASFPAALRVAAVEIAEQAANHIRRPENCAVAAAAEISF